MPAIPDDLRFAIRLLAKQPGFASVALLTLALGIGANIIIFALVNSVLLRPLPYTQPHSLVHLSGVPTPDGKEQQGISMPDLLDYRQHSQTLAVLAAYSFYPDRPIYSGAGEPEQVETIATNFNFFALLGARPLHGRTFAAGEDQLGQHRLIILSHSWWLSRHGGDPAILGKKLTLNANDYEVIGIMPPGFQFPQPAAGWTPIPVGSPNSRLRDAHIYKAIGRLRPGATVEAARQEILALGERNEQLYPQTNRGYRAALETLAHAITGEVRPTLYLLAVAVGVLLLTVCGNLANLLLARAASRQREFAIRSALGAPRARLLRQLLTESFALAALGGALGLLLAWWAVRLLRVLSLPSLPRLDELQLDGASIAFTIAIVTLTALLFGLAPALLATDLQAAGGRGATGGRRQSSLRGALVIAEVALASFLLIGAGLLLESVRRLLAVDAGFRTATVTVLDLSLPTRRFASPDAAAQFVQTYLDRIRALPGVQSAAATIFPPLGGVYSFMDLTIPGEPPPAVKPTVGNVSVTPGYFETFRIPLLAGRLFEPRDAKDSPRVVILSAPMARQFFPGQNPLGRKITLSYGAEWTGEIVGIVGGIRRRGLADEPRAEVYIPFAQMPYPPLTIALRSPLSPSQIAGALKQEMRQLDPTIPLNRIRSMDDVVHESIAASRLLSLVTLLFAGAALLLATIGIYGVMAYSVARRAKELGIRLALGAAPAQILRLVMGQGLRLAACGLGAGLILAALAGQALAAVLYGISPWNPLVYSAVALLLTLVAALATFLPAWRATRIDPATALRGE
ncbi:MAG: ABC transporter permease [Acidobacteriota bacterium]